MSFYGQISPYYDEIFTVDANEMKFIKEKLGSARMILDIGCGTGNKTELLSTPGNRIYAFDDDLAMVERAQKEHAASNISYEVLSMNDMGGRFKGMRFDAMLCLGNTLVHLRSLAEISAFVSTCGKIIAPQGRFVVQILNYDHILDNKVSELPPLASEQAIFLRSYVPEDGALRFVTTLQVRSSGHKYTNEVKLQPLRKADLERMLKEAGFEFIEYYGSYKGEPFTGSSFVLVAVCAKQKRGA